MLTLGLTALTLPLSSYQNRRLRITAVVLLASCTTVSAPVIQEPFAPVTHRAIKIEPCDDRTGFTGTRNLKEEATRIFTEKVKAMKLFEISMDAPLVLTCDIESFTEGSALKRWVAPGWGATEATVAVVVRDAGADKVLAALRSQSSVRSGGVFSVGADQYILDVAFNDIINHIQRRTPKRKQ